MRNQDLIARHADGFTTIISVLGDCVRRVEARAEDSREE